jgi:signal transduction histidine kinase
LWLLLLCLLLVLPHALGFAVVSAGDWPVGTSVAMLRMSATVLALVGACLLCIHWWVSANAATAWLGAALLSLGITQIPSALLELNNATAVAIQTPNTLLDTLLTLPFIALLAAGMGTRTFTHRITPILLGVVTGLTFGAARIVYSALDLERRLQLAEQSVTTGMVAAPVLGGLVVLIVRRLDGLPPWALHEMTLAAIAVIYGHVARLDTLDESGPWAVVGSAFLLVGSVILASTSAELLRGALRENEKKLRLHEETLHELRGTIAGVTSASRILLGMNAELSPAHKRRLTELLTTEMHRLEHLVADNSGERPAMVELDPVIANMVSTYRYLGLAIQWPPSGAWAWTRPSDLAEVLHILLSNTARHAPGATAYVSARIVGDQTEVLVRDDGPGIPASLREKVFERGTRQSRSTGHGLGLYLARQILAEHGGTLDLVEEGSAGTAFAIRLPLREPR